MSGQIAIVGGFLWGWGSVKGMFGGIVWGLVVIVVGVVLKFQDLGLRKSENTLAHAGGIHPCCRRVFPGLQALLITSAMALEPHGSNRFSNGICGILSIFYLFQSTNIP